MARSILVVDDSPDDVDLTLMACEGTTLEGRLVIARSSEDALLRLLPRGKGRLDLPAAVLLDVMMPKLDGFEVLARLRGDRRTRALPVIMLTSSDQEQDRARARKLGADLYLRKPIAFDDFVEVVKRIEAFLAQRAQPV
jgi:two-component system, response regulator